MATYISLLHVYSLFSVHWFRFMYQKHYCYKKLAAYVYFVQQFRTNSHHHLFRLYVISVCILRIAIILPLYDIKVHVWTSQYICQNKIFYAAIKAKRRKEEVTWTKKNKTIFNRELFQIGPPSALADAVQSFFPSKSYRTMYQICTRTDETYRQA